ncbi:MAG TPA: bifunctional DNA primase/polymerase [Pyrinomonadaceae bacterium]|jgi:hypothetical protein
MTQPAPQSFTRRDATNARHSYQHVAAVVNRLLNRIMQSLDEEARKAFKPSVFHTVHALHGFFHGQDLSKRGKALMKSHQFVTPYFDYVGKPENAAKFMGSRLDALRAAEVACGRGFVTIERADGVTQLFTWYKAHPLLDAAEAVYFKARQSESYWKNARAAVTDELLDEAIAALPVVTPTRKPEAERPAPECGHSAGSGECDECEDWASGDLAGGQVLKGRWTKWENTAQAILEAEFDAGGDPALVAEARAAKLIQMGKAIKQKRAREVLRSALTRSADVIADGPASYPAEPSTAQILAEVDAGAWDSGKDSVTDSEGDPREISLGGTLEAAPVQTFAEEAGAEESESEALPFALDMAEQGLAVFPVYGCTDGVCHCRKGSECRSAGKHPIPALTPRGVKNATTDTAKIRRWFAKEPHANLAWAMGGSLRLIGVDVDPRSGGDASLCDLVEAHGDAWLETFTVRTGSLGTHFIFRLPEGVEPHRAKLAPGIDLKAEGGYLVAPPSVHASGRRYEVEKNIYIAEAPVWLVEELTRAEGEPARVPVDFQAYRDRKASGSGPVIVEGERNERLFRVGCALWGKGEVSSRGDLLAELMRVNSERVSPPLESNEVYKIVDSIAGRYPPGMPIQDGAA